MAGGKLAMMRTNEIYKDIIRMLIEGNSRADINLFIREKYAITERQAKTHIRNAYKKQLAIDEKNLGALRFIQIKRFEKVYNAAFERHDYRSAVAAAVEINKLFSLYDNKVKVEVTGDVIKFDFDRLTQPVQEVTDVICGEIIPPNNEEENVQIGEQNE